MLVLGALNRLVLLWYLTLSSLTRTEVAGRLGKQKATTTPAPASKRRLASALLWAGMDKQQRRLVWGVPGLGFTWRLWVVIKGVISPLIWVINIVTLTYNPTYNYP